MPLPCRQRQVEYSRSLTDIATILHEQLIIYNRVQHVALIRSRMARVGWVADSRRH